MKLLVTGFEPFGGETVNPALEAVFALPKTIRGAEIIPLKIPTVFGRSLIVIEEAIMKEQPDVVVSIGQAGGIAGLNIEAVAINLNEARIADNEGNQPCDQKIFDDGENAYFSTLPIKAMCAAVHEKQIPASISYSAGTFVCNHVFYGVRYLAEKRYPHLRSGFIHIPYLVEQCVDKRNMPSMSLPVIVEGLIAAIGAIVDEQPITDGNFGTLY